MHETAFIGVDAIHFNRDLLECTSADFERRILDVIPNDVRFQVLDVVPSDAMDGDSDVGPRVMPEVIRRWTTK